MGITRRRLRLRMAEQRTDDRQRLAAAGGDAGERMPQIMDAHIIKAGCLSDAPPWLLRVDQPGTLTLSAYDKRIALKPGQVRQDLQRRGIEIDDLRPGLASGNRSRLFS